MCDRTFSEESLLRRHENSVHLNNHLRKLKCKHCEEIFSNASSLNQHVKNLHLEQRSDYKCDICEEIFNTKGTH